MSNEIFCPVCKERELSLLYPANIKKNYFIGSYLISGLDYGQHLDIYHCQKCGLVFERIDLLKREITNYYQNWQDSVYEEERANRAVSFRRIISKIKSLKPTGKLLDVGCATGALLIEAKKKGYEVYGIESSSWASEIARGKYGLNVTTGFIEGSEFSRNSFDIVTMVDVIEHFQEPGVSLQKIFRLLKKDGLICVVTPNIESFAAKIFGERWWHIRPGHFFYFSPQTIKTLFEMAGFETIFSRTYKWYLSFSYLFERGLKLLSLQSKPNEILKKITLGIDLKDSLEVYATKK